MQQNEEKYPIMSYVAELENKVRKLQEDNKHLSYRYAMFALWSMSFAQPIAICVGVAIGAGIVEGLHLFLG